MPALLLSNLGYNFSVLTLADHQGRFERFVGFEVLDCGKKLLMPGAKKYLAATFQIGHPGFLIFNRDAECPGIET